MFQPLTGHHQADIQNMSRNCAHHLWKTDFDSYRLCYTSVFCTFKFKIKYV